MKYITIFGILEHDRIKSGTRTYWLETNSGIRLEGFFLLEKNVLSSYKILRFLESKEKIVSGEDFED